MTSERRTAATERARSRMKRGSERMERAEARISRSLGEPALFAILIILIIRSVTLPGAAAE